MEAVVRWALEHYLGVVERDPEPLPYDPERAQEIAGHYENEFMTLIIDTDGDTMTVECRIKPEIRAASETELPPDMPPVGLGLLPGNALANTRRCLEILRADPRSGAHHDRQHRLRGDLSTHRHNGRDLGVPC
jgi:hypothetical protein